MNRGEREIRVGAWYIYTCINTNLFNKQVKGMQMISDLHTGTISRNVILF